jgi:hypothetical protein
MGKTNFPDLQTKEKQEILRRPIKIERVFKLKNHWGIDFLEFSFIDLLTGKHFKSCSQNYPEIISDATLRFNLGFGKTGKPKILIEKVKQEGEKWVLSE